MKWAVRQFQHAADLIGIDRRYQDILAEPKNEILVNFPVRMDDGDDSDVPWLPDPAQQFARALQRRTAFPPGGGSG